MNHRLRALGPAMYAKSATMFFLQFYTLQYFGATGDSLGQRSPLSALMYSKAPSINLSSPVDFVDGLTDTHKTVNDIRIPRGHLTNKEKKLKTTRMWASVQPNGGPAEYRRRPLFNAAKFG